MTTQDKLLAPVYAAHKKYWDRARGGDVAAIEAIASALRKHYRQFGPEVSGQRTGAVKVRGFAVELLWLCHDSNIVPPKELIFATSELLGVIGRKAPPGLSPGPDLTWRQVKDSWHKLAQYDAANPKASVRKAAGETGLSETTVQKHRKKEGYPEQVEAYRIYNAELVDPDA